MWVLPGLISEVDNYSDTVVDTILLVPSSISNEFETVEPTKLSWKIIDIFLFIFVFKYYCNRPGMAIL